MKGQTHGVTAPTRQGTGPNVGTPNVAVVGRSGSDRVGLAHPIRFQLVRPDPLEAPALRAVHSSPDAVLDTVRDGVRQAGVLYLAAGTDRLRPRLFVGVELPDEEFVIGGGARRARSPARRRHLEPCPGSSKPGVVGSGRRRDARLAIGPGETHVSGASALTELAAQSWCPHGQPSMSDSERQPGLQYSSPSAVIQVHTSCRQFISRSFPRLRLHEPLPKRGASHRWISPGQTRPAGSQAMAVTTADVDAAPA